MFKNILIACAGVAFLGLLLVDHPSEVDAAGRGAGARGGARPAPRPAARPAPRPAAPSRSPSMSRPAPRPSPGGGVNRPNVGGGGGRPNVGGGGVPNRPNVGGGGVPNRPSVGAGTLPKPPGGGYQRPATLPSAGNKLPNTGGKLPNLPSTGGKLPNNNLPGTGGKLPNNNLPSGGINRPNNNLPNTRPGGGPSRGELNDFLGGGGATTLPARPNIGNGSGNIINNGNINTGNNININNNKQAWIDNRHVTGNVNRVNAGNRYWAAYNSGAYYGYKGGYNYRRGWAAGYAWGVVTAVAVRNWFGWNNWIPAYYYYGDGGNVYYENDTVYVDEKPVGSTEEYYNQAQTLVKAAPEKVADTEEWMPLGVYMLTREDVDDSQSMIELAVNKKGVVAGTYYNEATGVSRPLKGTIDVKTQRTAIGFGDGKNPEIVLETGVANLTDDETPALLHTANDTSDPVLLVRLKKPEGEK